MMIGAIHLEDHLEDMKTMLERLLKESTEKDAQIKSKSKQIAR